MIRHYLPNNNESATVSKPKKIRKLEYMCLLRWTRVCRAIPVQPFSYAYGLDDNDLNHGRN